MKQNKNDTYFTITSNCIVRNVLLNKSELFICRTSEIEYAWGYLVRTVVLIAPLTGQQSHSPFFSTSPDWLQMPPLTSKTAFQPCCPGNQCWRGYWDGSQHALRACLSSFSYKLSGGQSSFVGRNLLTSHQQEPHIHPSFKTSLSKDPLYQPMWSHMKLTP